MILEIPRQNNTLITRSSQLNGSVKLLFRHDDFFPVETNITQLSENCTVSMKTDPRKTIFNPTQIHSYHFTIAAADSTFMEKNALKEQYVPADFTFNDSLIGKVGIRFKGSQYYLLKQCFDSTGRLLDDSICMKVSLKVKFNKYTDSLRLFSLKRLNLHGMSDDPSKMHEMISYKLFRDMGIYAPKTAYTKVYINGACWGVFIAVEELDGRFTQSRWPETGDGNLYKELWASYHTEKEILKTLETNDAPEDSASVKRMWNFGKAANYVTASNFKKTISPFMDINYWLRYITVDRAVHNADGIMTWYFDSVSGWSGNHNFYFYEEEGADGKFWLIPWDLPATLTRTDLIIDNFKVPEWNVKPQNCETAYPIWSKDLALAPNCDKLTGATAEAMWPDFVTIGEQFLASVFTTEHLQATVDTLASILSPAIEKDPTINFNWWKEHVDYLRKSMPILHSGYDAYLHGLTTPGDSSGSEIPIQ
jgi:spore coat protein CotH